MDKGVPAIVAESSKWLFPSRNLAVGDVILVTAENLKPLAKTFLSGRLKGSKKFSQIRKVWCLRSKLK